MKTAALLATLAPALAAEIHVPGDHASLQAAIDAAAHGDVIVVSGGLKAGVVVDKPLTIVFDVAGPWGIGCGVDPACGACLDDNAFRLAGPGHGRVTIVGYHGVSKDCFHPAPAIEGGGFDELALVDCTIAIDAGLSGLGHGAHALDVEVGFVALSGCDVRALGSHADHCAGFLFEDLAAGVHAPGAVVLVLDSQVRGGDGGVLCCIGCACPALPDPAFGGTGGPGIVAREVHHAGSEITGGRGSAFAAFACCDPYHPEGEPVACGKQPDGAPIVAPVAVELGGTLSGPSTVAAGAAYAIAWDLPGPGAYLFASAAVAPPTPAAGAPGAIALDVSALTPLGPIATGAPASLALPVPADPGMIGAGLAFQALDATLGLTRPVLGVVTP